MEFYDEKIKALAIEIYELDAEVYKKLGSSLGRVFGGEKDICIRNIMEDLHSRQNSSRIRSELALISNMARTIPDHDTRHDVMVRYNNIVEEIAELPTGFADGDILDPKIADLNTVNLKDRFKTGDHLIICIGRSCGCGGNEIGFALAMGKLMTVHLNDQNGIKYDQDKSFGVENLRAAFNQVKVLKENGYGEHGEYVGLDVKAMRTTKDEDSYKHLQTSLEVFRMLEEKVDKFDYDFQKKCVENRDFESLELYVMKLLMGVN